ncbi:Proto-oncogene tyrosine-protein kinase ROS-like protein, partial [Leptotrombidium deliense]
TDLKGKNRAFLRVPGLQELESVNLIDPSLQQLPKINGTSIVAIVRPNRVLHSSIRVEGKWDNFTVYWNPVDNVNFGEIYYDFSVNVKGYTDSKLNVNRNIITKNPYYNYPCTHKLQPYSLLKVYIKSFTYWASGEGVSVDVFTPMSTPSKPQNPRVFITNSNGNISAEFRWLPSLSPNGVIKYYKVNVWYEYDLLGRVDHSKVNIVSGASLSFKASNLRKDRIYYFQVQAFTEAGAGPFSDLINANTSVDQFVPKLITIRNDAITLFDVDLLRETEVFKKVINAVAVTYIENENTIFWIEEDKILKAFNFAKNTSIILHTMNGISTSLTADWISRNLYWSEIDLNENKSNVWRLDLNSKAKPEIVFKRSK